MATKDGQSNGAPPSPLSPGVESPGLISSPKLSLPSLLDGTSSPVKRSIESKLNGQQEGSEKLTPVFATGRGKRKPKIHVCVCGSKVCRELTQLLSHKFMGHSRGGVTTLPVGNKPVDKFRRKRWLEYLQVSIPDSDRRRLRVSRAHFREPDLEKATDFAGGGWGIKKWSTSDSGVIEDRYFLKGDGKTSRYRTITVPTVTEEDMKKEIQELKSRQVDHAVPPQEKKRKLEHVMDLAQEILKEITMTTSPPQSPTSKARKGKGKGAGDDADEDDLLADDKNNAEYHIQQAQKFIMNLIAKLKDENVAENK